MHETNSTRSSRDGCKLFVGSLVDLPSSCSIPHSSTRTMARQAFVVGYTGETGKELVKELIKSDAIQKLVLIGRREVKLEQEDAKVVCKFAQALQEFDVHTQTSDENQKYLLNVVDSLFVDKRFVRAFFSASSCRRYPFSSGWCT